MRRMMLLAFVAAACSDDGAGAPSDAGTDAAVSVGTQDGGADGPADAAAADAGSGERIVQLSAGQARTDRGRLFEFSLSDGRLAATQIPGRFRHLGRVGCAIRDDGTTECPAPPHLWRSVEGGIGLREDGTVMYWRSIDRVGLTDVNELGPGVAVGGGACWLTTDGLPQCWDQPVELPVRRYGALLMDHATRCGALVDGSGIVCVPVGAAGAEPTVFSGGVDVVGLDCVTYRDRTECGSEPPRGGFVALRAIYPGVCGLRASGAVECWSRSGPPVSFRFDLADLEAAASE